ncbi:nucleoside-diphosphate sugar epimerase [Bacillus sp. S13(2024)]|uniref:nucleoside-diphosphate sugar epimerase n=1 Tax=unclassified Bacillus (in: firmicutes) TaxID=185979 RepID=UPI003D259B28
MYYQQSNVIRKIIEPTITFIIMAIIFSHLHTPWASYEYLVTMLVVILFSNRYGMNIALFVFLESFLYSILIGIYRGEDVFLYFLSLNHWMNWCVLLIASVSCGLNSTSQKERYQDIHITNIELQKENEELKRTVEQLHETKLTLKSRILESDNHLSTMFHIFKALNHAHPEIVLDEGMNVLKQYFGAQRIGIYYVDDNKHSLRIKLRSEIHPKKLPQSIFVKEASSVIKQALEYNKPFFRTRTDTEDAPLLVGPVSIQEKIQYLIILDDIDFTKVTSQQFELFVWYLRWMSNRLENASDIWLADKASRTFPETDIYYETEFEHLLKIEKERYKILDYPYSYFEFSADQPSLQIINRVLKEHLRDIDIFGYKVEEQKVMVLLPGTEGQFLSIVKDRIMKALKVELVVM